MKLIKVKVTPGMEVKGTVHIPITLEKWQWKIIMEIADRHHGGNIDTLCQEIFRTGFEQGVRLLGIEIGEGPGQEEQSERDISHMAPGGSA